MSCLNDQSMVSLSRVDVDNIVTEHGVAHLSGASVHERARAIISVADPAQRGDLEQAWQQIAQRL